MLFFKRKSVPNNILMVYMCSLPFADHSQRAHTLRANVQLRRTKGVGRSTRQNMSQQYGTSRLLSLARVYQWCLVMVSVQNTIFQIQSYRNANTYAVHTPLQLQQKRPTRSRLHIGHTQSTRSTAGQYTRSGPRPAATKFTHPEPAARQIARQGRDRLSFEHIR